MQASSSAERSEAILAESAALAPELVDLRHRLHREPELGLELPRTQEKVLEWLDGLGLEVSVGTELSSVTAVLRGEGGGAGPKPTMLLRGDMDALPVQERTGIAYASHIPGRMHACGHDIHTAALAGAATLLASRRQELAGDVVFMFQPGEEGHDGAGKMIAEGVLTASGARADAAFGLHVSSSLAPSGQVLTRNGAIMSSGATLSVTVEGAGGHGSTPHLVADPITVAAEMVTALQRFIVHRFDVFEPVVITVGMIEGGTQCNIIPETVHFEASARAFSDAALERVAEEAPRLLRGIAQSHGLDARITFEHLFPLTASNDVELAGVRESVDELFGAERSTTLVNPMTWSEDFSRVLNEVPGAFVFLSAAPEGSDYRRAPFNHSPHALFDDRAVTDGAALHARVALDRLDALGASTPYAQGEYARAHGSETITT